MVALLFRGGNIYRMSIEDHDPSMAYVLVLSYMMNLAFSEVLILVRF
ncbi:MAG TPA: hypothetical protein O0W88_03955 [Methanocorpusculum sp.]|nr:hypothetical protein [Methanocorpusculum sp.]